MTDNISLRREIRDLIEKLKSAEDIFNLFKLLNYPDSILFDTTSKRKKENFDLKKDDIDRIKEIYAVLSIEELHVFLIEAKTLVPSFIRSVTTTFDKQYLNFLLIFTVDYFEVIFVFPKRERVETGKHKLKLTKLIINKEEIIDKKEHYTVIETLSNIYFEKEGAWREIWKKWKKAFSVERVTEAFFEDYKRIFFKLREEFEKQNIPSKEGHEFTLQFLNRIMFIYFISKKRWIEYSKFMEWLWTSYKKLNKYGTNEFYEKWLRQVFFKAFNNRSNEITGLPEEVKKVISSSPYLNGGLFKENKLDNLNIKITDKLFQEVFDFFEKYNFTIKEDMPLESEVAVDPQMIGYVYESLANVAEEIYTRNDLGIFYTPRVEVDFMCRRVIVEYLSKNLTNVPKDKIYHLVFDFPEEKEKIEKWFDKERLWFKLEEILDNLSVVDPACGSGAFLVGMLNVLVEIYKIVNKHINRKLSDFALKNKIIQYSLYGIDVMPWAIHAAELRLWLQLIVETKFKKEELKKHPLLPNLNLNLRIGDSLVQEIGGISFNIRTNNLRPHLKKKLEDLKYEKRKYFINDPIAKFKTPEEVKTEEIRLFEEIIDERIEKLEIGLKAIIDEIKRKGRQITLDGDFDIRDNKRIKISKKKIENIKNEIDKLKKIKGLLKDPEKKPFVWDVDFAEVFSHKGGFDIVIGNPPYIRQEMILPPNKLSGKITSEEKRKYNKEYKEKLVKSVKNIFPVINKIDMKSDYYIYFYFHGLSLLNEKGTFCFITSNSWLDVGYGKNLQEFLLKYVPITAIYDNPKRSFAHADVNTVIALFGAPRFKKEKLIQGLKVLGNGKENWPMLQHIAKFVMFKKPFEEAINTKNLIEIENIEVNVKGKGITELVKNVVTRSDFRIFPILQEDLLEDGWAYPENYNNKKGKFKAGRYIGNKWGGKFIRSPDIFFKILEKGRDILVDLGSIVDVKFGIKTGVNKFFYIDNEVQNKWKIEKEFLKPVIKSPRESSSIAINLKNLKYKLFMCHKSKSEIVGTNALKYIEWGEKQKTKKGILWHRVPSVSGRNYWYNLGEFKKDCFLWPRVHFDSHRIYECHIYASDTFSLLYPKYDYKITGAILNSTLLWFYKELYGRKVLGEGGLSSLGVDLIKIEALNPMNFENNDKIIEYFQKMKIREIGSVFEELGFNPSKPIREQDPKPLPDRGKLDKIIFDKLGLTEEETKEVYWSLAELVKERLDKASSLNK